MTEILLIMFVVMIMFTLFEIASKLGKLLKAIDGLRNDVRRRRI